MKPLTGKGKPFHSAIDKAAGMLKRKVGTGAEFMKELMALPGIKQSEIAERGLGELMGAPKMTHEQFMAALGSKPAPAIGEKVLGGDRSEPDSEAPYHGKWTLPGGENYREMLIKAPKKIEKGYKSPNGAFFTEEELADPVTRKTVEKIGLSPAERDVSDHFGGISHHFGGEPGILASMRVKDRMVPDLEGPHNVKVTGGGGFTNVKHKTREDAERFADLKHQGGYRTEITPMNQKKLLHLEELQSDWHQEGRENGYKDPQAEQKFNQADELKRTFDELNKRRRELHEQALREPDGGPRFQGLMDEANGITPKLLELNSQMHDLEHFKRQQQDAVPDAPFKKNWEEMALKRLIHHAAEKGYHGIVVTPGVEQADRYNIGNHIGYLGYHPEEERLKAYGHDRREVMNQTGVKKEDLPSHIGKEVAERLLKSPQMLGTHQLEGEDIHVGGEGMKGFYDKKVPNILNSIGKKYGVKTQLHGHQIAINNGMLEPQQGGGYKQTPPETKAVHHFPITEDMRKDILTNGLPLYADGGIIRKAEGGNVNAFDYENPEHVSAVAGHAVKHKDFKAYEPKLMAEVLSTGNHRHLEDPRIQYAMRQAGHNAYHVQEKTGKKLHKMQTVVKKAMGGTIQPSVNQMRIALNQNKLAIPASDLKGVGVNEAPQMDVKSFVNPGGQQDGELPVGGIDQDESKKGMQLMQAQQNLDPSKNQQQGGQPQSAGPSSPLQQPPSNILQMTPQGQAMNAMTPPQQPQAMADGGKVKPHLTHEMYMQLLKRHIAGERLSKAENEMLGLYHRVGGGKKLNKPIQEYSFTTAPNPNVNMAPEKLITPEDLQGGYGIPFIGDSSMAGRLLTGAEGHNFAQPVELEGGHDYMRANAMHEDPAKRAIWASAQGKISHLTKKAKRVSENGEPVYGIHTSMSPTGVDFSHMPVEVLAELVKNAKITKKAQAMFNKEMRAQHPEFPGVMHEELHDMLRAPGSGELRKHFVERMATDPYQEAGFPEIAMARLAVQHPNLMKHDKPGHEYVGSSIGKFRPDFGQVEEPVHPHHSYPSVIGGEYMGALHPEHAQPLMTTKEFFPEFHKHRREFNAPEAGDRRAFELAQPVQKFDQEWLDKVMPVYLKRRKKILGYKKGSKVTDNLDTMRFALTKNSKKAK